MDGIRVAQAHPIVVCCPEMPQRLSFLFVVGEGYSPVTQSLFQMFKRTFVLLQTKFNDTFVAILTFTKTEEKYNN